MKANFPQTTSSTIQRIHRSAIEHVTAVQRALLGLIARYPRSEYRFAGKQLKRKRC
jgi:hypothetical protein